MLLPGRRPSKNRKRKTFRFADLHNIYYGQDRLWITPQTCLPATTATRNIRFVADGRRSSTTAKARGGMSVVSTALVRLLTFLAAMLGDWNI